MSLSAPFDHNLLLSRLQRQNSNLEAILPPDSEEHRLPAGQNFRLPILNFALFTVGDRQALRLASSG